MTQTPNLGGKQEAEFHVVKEEEAGKGVQKRWSWELL